VLDAREIVSAFRSSIPDRTPSRCAEERRLRSTRGSGALTWIWLPDAGGNAVQTEVTDWAATNDRVRVMTNRGNFKPANW
jgi:hypothetical protein